MILVYAPDGVPRREPGEEIGIRAEVTRFTQPAAEALGEAFADVEALPVAATDVGARICYSGPWWWPTAGRRTSRSSTDERRWLKSFEESREFYGDAVEVAGKSYG